RKEFAEGRLRSEQAHAGNQTSTITLAAGDHSSAETREADHAVRSLAPEPSAAARGGASAPAAHAPPSPKVAAGPAPSTAQPALAGQQTSGQYSLSVNGFSVTTTTAQLSVNGAPVASPAPTLASADISAGKDGVMKQARDDADRSPTKNQ